jgi:4-hydroxy-tetrahydrodipicolinate reductase
MKTLKILVTGAAGRMGREVVKAVHAADGMTIVGAVDPSHAAADAGEIAGVGTLGVPVDADLAATLRRTNPDVVVDFTRPAEVMANLREVLGAGAAAVVGTTGFTDADLEEVRALCRTHATACLVAPNFAIGAVLMMQFAQEAARFLPDCEIIEMHHNQKLDAPSGTAMKTAQMVAEARGQGSGDKTEKVALPGARGGEYEGVRVHSVRLPGFVASQAVIFGGQGQTLTIRHDTLDRTSFMPGVLLAIRAIADRTGLIYGLENILRAEG